MKSFFLSGVLLLCASSAFSATVWDRVITHPLEGGRLLSGDRCHFGTTNCAASGVHLGVDLMAAAGSAVLAMCDGVVKHNNTASATIWNSKVIVEHNCGGHFQKIYGYYGHVSSDLAVGASISSARQIGTLKNDGSNSHLHMGVSYFYQESNWGYGTSTENWLDFQEVVYRSSVKPQLRSPVGGVAVNSNIDFSWNPVAGASSYRIVVSQDQNPLRNFDNLTRACTGTQNGGSACWTNSDAITSANFSRTFSDNKTYYWVVRANNSDWSDVGVFSTGQVMSEANKAERILNCVESLVPEYFSGHQATQNISMSDGSVAYVRAYSSYRYHQAVLKNGWYFHLGDEWRYFGDIDSLKGRYCPSAW